MWESIHMACERGYDAYGLHFSKEVSWSCCVLRLLPKARANIIHDLSANSPTDDVASDAINSQINDEVVLDPIQNFQL